MGDELFPALLRYWRGRRGLSQLDLALEAGVSARHLSFLESGRARPGEEMVLRLFSVLAAPLREQNQALLAAGFAPRFPAPALDAMAPEVEQALEQMMAQHEPFPLVVLSLDGTVVRSNRAARTLFGAFVSEPAALRQPLDMFSLLLDERLMKPFVIEWELLARSMVTRLHRERLQRGDSKLAAVLERVLSFPGVPRAWRQPDFSTETHPTLRVQLARGALRVGFLVTVTVFSAPQQVTLDELRIESCFPLDDQTRKVCERFARAPSTRKRPVRRRG
ncbi:helix-turn-helix domain-containing protein [Pyxidicoccus xibeiensis]|uniref:helix-turn-helix domain-containing protein n=1 Tax=Pyxidicoccus xibeiensis TaxID=2906759 RepID=UPI0020A71FC2|nr:helix-turn-helix domain-containing protein [Pyxidicoccus xibeiensis]MCP3140524.1 helix-turn-helix domain-containing protein [Pyxidicoccus xibeiensis]